MHAFTSYVETVMDPDVLKFAQLCAVIALFAGSISAIGVWTAAAVKKLKRKETPMMDAERRLEQLQQSVDTIAIEVERISEAQRFTTKLLSQRAEVPALEE